MVEVEVVKKLSEESESTGSAIPILCFPERNDEDTFWTHVDETKPPSTTNKFKSEDMTRVRQRKELLWTEVVKNDPTSDRGYKVTGTVQVPTIRHHGEVESRQGAQIELNLRESAENVPDTVDLL